MNDPYYTRYEKAFPDLFVLVAYVAGENVAVREALGPVHENEESKVSQYVVYIDLSLSLSLTWRTP